MVTEVAMAAALTRSASATGSAIMDGNSVDSTSAGGDRVKFQHNELLSDRFHYWHFMLQLDHCEIFSQK